MGIETVVELSGDSRAYRADETGRWVIVSAEDWRDLERRLAKGQTDAYSLWCAETSSGREVSARDDHDLLDAICDAGGAAERDYECQCGRATGESCQWSGHRDELHLVRWVPESDRGSAQASGTGTRGAYAKKLYVSPECADMLAHVYEDGEQTAALDPYVEDCGVAYP